ncbi:MAG: hypothetical protein BroJett040_13210 [Oligoflexia bacterium]|nr:MAG: hypothetical protein BroJett040_13210 [Oligoflexia bacterium]
MKNTLFIALCLFSKVLLANQLTYPELQVQPKATDRIRMEAQKERASGWKVHLPVMASSAMTLAAASMSQAGPTDKVSSEDASLAKNVGMGVGAGWLITSYLLSSLYDPYSNAEIALRTSGQQDPLARERLAEEHLRSAHDLGVRVMWLSAISQFFTNAYVASKSSRNTSYIAGIAAVTSFAPVLFKSNWISTWEYHQEYKKKIYGPIAMPIMMTVPGTHVAQGSVTPGLGLFLSF